MAAGPNDEHELIRTILRASASAHDRFAGYGLDAVAKAAHAMAGALAAGRTVLVFGNGGSASDAQHVVAELVGRFDVERRSLAAVALTADSNIVTAIANDYGYERVFSRQIEGLGRAGDVAFGISTSGQSKNVEAALATARARGLVTIALTGRDGGDVGRMVDVHINVPDAVTARVQEVHCTLIHALCEIIEEG